LTTEQQSAVFLPLSAQTDDLETVTWCRGVPLLIAEEVHALGLARVSFAAWTTGKGPSLRLCHLQTAPPVGHVAAYARAARARVGISGWGSWHGDPFMRWEVVGADGQEARRVSVDAPLGASCVQVVRMAFETAKLVLGLMDDRGAGVLEATESDGALLAWLHDREHVWYRRRRGLQGGGWEGQYRFLLSALTHDPCFEPAARQLVQRAGSSLASPAPGSEAASAQPEAIEALAAMVRLRLDDHVAWTLKGMLERSLKRTEDAVTSLRRAASLAPEYMPAHRELGGLFLDAHELRTAGAHLRRAGKLAPKDPEVQYNLGLLYLSLKDRRRAAQHLQVVLRVASGSALARTAARMLRDLEDGPTRRPTSALGEVVTRPVRSKDRDLIARMFGHGGDVPDEDATSPGEDFLDRLDDEKTAWPSSG
jgi:tetratricopeptide (TPR) repeat protein